MATSLSINDILDQVKRLDKKALLTLLQRIENLLKKEEARTPAKVDLTSLSGLGSEIWKSTKDLDDHIDGDRQW